MLKAFGFCCLIFFLHRGLLRTSKASALQNLGIFPSKQTRRYSLCNLNFPHQRLAAAAAAGMGAGPSNSARDQASIEEPKSSMEVRANHREDPKKSQDNKEQDKLMVITGTSATEEPKKEPKRSTGELERLKGVTSTNTEEKKKAAPHKYEVITKDADNPPVVSSETSGVFLDDRKKKYWVEERGYNCFMVFPRGLLITWSDDDRFWQWQSQKETGNVEIEIASLQNVCWLEIHGRFETSHLTPGIKYEVVFVVMLKGFAYGWEVPVNLRLKLADGTKQEHRESLHEKPKAQWIELPVGEFMTHPNQTGEMEFSLFEYDGGQWKRGLVVKGAIIRPKK